MSVDAISRSAPTMPSKFRAGWLPILVGMGLILALLVGGLVVIPRYRAAHPATALQRSDADRVAVDDLYLDLTLVTPKFLASRDLKRYMGDRDPATVLPVLVGINTHTGSIEHMHHLDGDLFLVGGDGARYPALTEPIVLTQHHNAYMLLFPPLDNHGVPFLNQAQGQVTVEAVGMGDTAVRRFEWQLPLDEDAKHGLAETLMLVVALTSALLVVLSPCALELTLYYTAIISATVGEGTAEAFRTDGLRAARSGRRRVIVNLASFVIGFTLLYSLAGATVGLIGQGVRKPLGQYSHVIQVIGGCLILFFAIRVLGLDRYLGRQIRDLGRRLIGPSVKTLWQDARSAASRQLGKLRFRGASRAARHGTMRPLDSFLVGLGLSSSCLGCMGGAVLYPLLVYAGITSWYSGLITLGLYSLGIALPMLAIALGFFRLRLSLGRRVGVTRALRIVSGTLLAGIGLLIITGQERIMTDVAFGFMAGVSQWIG